jgi:uncharacterized protein (DUF736 family)
MATIGTFTKTDGGYTGAVKTLTLNRPSELMHPRNGLLQKALAR